jgi:hypothetical protein
VKLSYQAIKLIFYSLVIYIETNFSEKIQINTITPFSTLKSSLNVLINTNYSNLYSSLIKYQCVYGNSKSDAFLLNFQFNCTFTKVSPNSGFNISLILVSNLKNQEIQFSQNSLPFYFMGLKLFILNSRFH